MENTTIPKEEVLEFIWEEVEKVELEEEINRDLQIIDDYYDLEKFLVICTKLFIQFYPNFGGIENRRRLLDFAEDFIYIYLHRAINKID